MPVPKKLEKEKVAIDSMLSEISSYVKQARAPYYTRHVMAPPKIELPKRRDSDDYDADYPMMEEAN